MLALVCLGKRILPLLLSLMLIDSEVTDESDKRIAVFFDEVRKHDSLRDARVLAELQVTETLVIMNGPLFSGRNLTPALAGRAWGRIILLANEDRPIAIRAINHDIRILGVAQHGVNLLPNGIDVLGRVDVLSVKVAAVVVREAGDVDSRHVSHTKLEPWCYRRNRM